MGWETLFTWGPWWCWNSILLRECLVRSHFPMNNMSGRVIARGSYILLDDRHNAYYLLITTILQGRPTFSDRCWNALTTFIKRADSPIYGQWEIPPRCQPNPTPTLPPAAPPLSTKLISSWVHRGRWIWQIMFSDGCFWATEGNRKF